MTTNKESPAAAAAYNKAKSELDARMKEWQEAQEIRCPYCNHLQSNDDGQYPISYHGEDGYEGFECDECAESFFVEENVERTFRIATKQCGCNRATNRECWDHEEKG